MAVREPLESVEPKPHLLIANWQNELDSADLYRYLAQLEEDPTRAALLAEMAEAEESHAGVMAKGLAEQGINLPRHRLSFRTRVLKTFARIAGPKAVYPLLHGTEISGSAEYAAQDRATAAL